MQNMMAMTKIMMCAISSMRKRHSLPTLNACPITGVFVMMIAVKETRPIRASSRTIFW